jgi:hypothetical protein
MARTRKARPRVKAARTTAAPRSGGQKTPTRRKPVARKKTAYALSSDPLDNLVEASAHALALPLEPQWLAAIQANLEVNLRLAAFVGEFALPDESEPAPIFTA